MKPTVNGADVQVFEFADEAAQAAVAETISANGYNIGATSVDWISQPNFWSEGRVIVLYVWTDASIIELLTQQLGDPLTAPEAASTGEPASSGNESGGYLELVDMLRAGTATVEPGSEVDQPFFEPTV